MAARAARTAGRPGLVTSVVEPFFIGHRGGRGYNLDPENALEGVAAGAAAGVTYLAGVIMDGGDWRKGTDGHFLSCHASTTGASMDASVSVTAQNLTSWLNLHLNPESYSPAFPAGTGLLTPAYDDAFFAAVRDLRQVITPEQKTSGNAVEAAALIAKMQQYGLTNNVYYTSFNQIDLAVAKAAGFKTIRWVSGTAPTPASMLGVVDYYGYDVTDTTNQTPAQLQAVYDAGIKLQPYTIDRRYDFLTEQTRAGRPLAGCTSSDALWVSGQAPVVTTPPWGNAAPLAKLQPGHLPSRAGTFRSGGRFGFTGNGTCLQGWGSKPTQQTSIQVTVGFDNNVADLTRYGYIGFFAADDRRLDTTNGGTANAFGYRLHITQAGNVSLFRSDNGAQLGTTQAGAALSPGATTVIKIDRPTPTTLRIQRDGATVLNVTSSTFVGGYWHLGAADSGGTLQTTYSDAVVVQ